MFKLFRIKNYILVSFSVNFAYNISEQGNLLRLSAMQLEMRIVIFREINFYLPVLL